MRCSDHNSGLANWTLNIIQCKLSTVANLPTMELSTKNHEEGLNENISKDRVFGVTNLWLGSGTWEYGPRNEEENHRTQLPNHHFQLRAVNLRGGCMGFLWIFLPWPNIQKNQLLSPLGDTIAWTLGRIAQFHPSIVPVKQLMPLLCEKLRDVPRVSANICWNVQVEIGWNLER